MRAAIYPGSFDPLTSGHLSLIHRALRMFDKVIVAVAVNNKKQPLFSTEERKDLILTALDNDPRVEVDDFQGLLVDYARQRGVNTVVRGLRALGDFEYEFQIAAMNRRLHTELETVFMIPGENYFYISSSLVREVASYGGNLEGTVPPNVLQKLKEKYAKAKE